MATDNIFAGSITCAGLTNTGTTSLSGAVVITGSLSTTMGVISGTNLVVGGRAGTNTTTQAISNTVATEQFFDNLAVTLPANTLALGRRVRVRWHGEATVDSGADTLTIKIYIGSTAIVTTAAVNTAANDKFVGEFVMNAPSAAGAAALCFGWGMYTDPAATAFKVAQNANGGTALATNGALVVRASATWSATTATNTVVLDVFTVDIL